MKARQASITAYRWHDSVQLSALHHRKTLPLALGDETARLTLLCWHQPLHGGHSLRSSPRTLIYSETAHPRQVQYICEDIPGGSMFLAHIWQQSVALAVPLRIT